MNDLHRSMSNLMISLVWHPHISLPSISTLALDICLLYEWKTIMRVRQSCAWTFGKSSALDVTSNSELVRLSHRDWNAMICMTSARSKAELALAGQKKEFPAAHNNFTIMNSCVVKTFPSSFLLAFFSLTTGGNSLWMASFRSFFSPSPSGS